MFRQFVLALTIGLAIAPATACAEDAPAGDTVPASAARASVASVAGLAADDLLNIRAAASPLGKVLARLPNGSVVNRLECEVVEGYEWCRVASIEDEELAGWAPSRYLLVLEVEESSTAAIDDGETAERLASGEQPAADASMPLPAGLEARFAAEATPPAELSEAHLASLQTRLRTPPPAEAAPDPSTEPLPDEAAVDPSIPTPTPRPGSQASAPVTAEAAPVAELAETLPAEPAPAAAEVEPLAPTLVRAEPAQTASRALPPDATGEIPCARYTGQPMTRCTVSVTRKNGQDADVSVAWPDGGFRIIEFRDGEVVKANSRAELRHTREGSLNMIRIGVAERFEILDAIAFGD